MRNLNHKKIEEVLPGIKKNISLNAYTTFKIGGPAKYFFVAKNQRDLIKAIKVAKNFNLPFFVLGGGSNLLVSDKGYRGLIIKVQNTKYEINDKNIIYAEAGVRLGDLIKLSIEKSLTGLEWAAGVPGTLGGAIYGNAGAFGKSIGDSIRSVEAYDIKDNKVKIFKKGNCKFGYRDSIFKKNKNQSTKQSFVLGRAHKIMCSDLIILGAFLQLKKGNKIKIKEEIMEIIKKRKNKIPIEPSAGCIFKNPSPAQIYPKFMAGKRFSAGELIEKCGLKGKIIGKAKISEKHANFIVNLGGVKAKDVIKLIKLVKQKVKNKFGIKLEEEIQYLGF